MCTIDQRPSAILSWGVILQRFTQKVKAILQMRVLGIETSCDETAVAIYDSELGLLAHHVYSQKAHIEYGGVVPELASRDHVRKLLPIIKSLLVESGLSPKEIDGIAYTAGPGLVGALLVGAMLAKSLSVAWQIPSLGVHHMEGHLLAPMLEDSKPTFPFLALLVSGGHSQLIQVKALGDYVILGESLDDAAGEAFDKTAKLLGLPYPGGPHLAKLALQGNPTRFAFPRPLLHKGLDFSFSGLKTAVANALTPNMDTQTRADVAASFQEAVVDTLIIKSVRALEATGLEQLVIAGGVGANQSLRQRLSELGEQKGFKVFYPRPLFCTDNGAMIAYAGCQRMMAGEKDTQLQIRARWPLTELRTVI